MDMTTIIVCFFVFLAGLIDSIAGGGGLISLPAYVAAGVPPHMALGTNKFSSSLGTTVATARFIKSGKVQYKTAVFSIIFAFVGSTIGANIALMIDEKVISYLMLILVPIVAVLTLRKKSQEIKEKNFTPVQLVLCSSAIGLFLGMYDGFFGPGMGMFLILANTHILGLDMITAAGNSKMVNLASNLAALLTFVINGNVMYSIAIPAAVCGIAGNYLGSGLAIKGGSKVMRPVMIVVVILLLGQIILDLM